VIEDQLRDGLKCLQLAGSFFIRTELSAPWAYLSPEQEHMEFVLRPGGRRIILFHIFTRGRARLELSRGGGCDIEAGDIIILPFADQHRVGYPDASNAIDINTVMPPQPWSHMPIVTLGGGGEPTSMVCGYLICDDAPFNPVLSSLPPLMRVRPGTPALASWVDASVRYALAASEGRSTEGDPLLQRLPELLFMECLCEHVRTHEEDAGWLAALADPIVGRALGCMHREPQYRWTLEELAKRAASSRSILDERFRQFLGRAPMSYLIAWRLQLAARHLRSSSATLAEIADQIGYGSEAAFSRAFKRHTGSSPSEWRQTRAG
jgi:AraC-like DNA-binding protein